MISNRRKFIGTVLGATVALVMTPLRVWAARPDDAFQKESMSAVLKSQYGSESLEPGDIKIKAPDIAENGAVVPITVNFNVPGAEAVSIIAENNPAPLAASFDLSGGATGYVSTRIKMGKTSNVLAVVKSGGKLYKTTKEVKVTIGGCGG